MKVYHGSTLEVPKPLTSYSKRHLDFGNGFYATTLREQANRWARRKALRLEGDAVVSVYDLEDALDGFSVKTFEDNDAEWLEFVCLCRRGSDDYKLYDLVVGGVANDQVYLAVDMYYRGVWDRERTLKELSYYERNDQLCFINQRLIDQHLHFRESYKV